MDRRTSGCVPVVARLWRPHAAAAGPQPRAAALVGVTAPPRKEHDANVDEDHDRPGGRGSDRTGRVAPARPPRPPHPHRARTEAAVQTLQWDFYSGTVAAGGTRTYHWNNVPTGASYTVGLTPKGASTTRTASSRSPGPGTSRTTAVSASSGSPSRTSARSPAAAA